MEGARGEGGFAAPFGEVRQMVSRRKEAIMIQVGEVRDARTEKRNEWLESKVEQQEADIAYIAMMADVEMEGDGDAEVGAD